MLENVRDIFAILTICASVITIIKSAKIRKENLKLKKRLSFLEEDNLKVSDKVDYYENEYIPRIKEQLEKSGQEVTRLAVLKTERDVDYLIKGLEYIIGEKVKQGKQ